MRPAADPVIARIEGSIIGRSAPPHAKSNRCPDKSANSDFQIFVQFVAVVCLGHYRNKREIKEERLGAIRRMADLISVAERMIPGEFDLADLYLRPPPSSILKIK